MSKLDQMKNLRGGAIYAAARVGLTTVHSWGVELGTRQGSGHPRYDATDAVSLVIMRQLTVEMSIAAGQAAIIVNALRPMLPDAISKIVAEQEASGSWRWDGGPFAVVTKKPMPHGTPPSAWLRFVNEQELGQLLSDRSSGNSPLVLPLVRLINKGIYGLQRVLAGELVEDASE